MSNNLVKNQHYVPQFYLNNFATLKGKCYKLNLYDKENKEIRKNQNVENIASERYFTDLDAIKIFKEKNIQLEDKQFEEDLKNKYDKQHIEKNFATRVEPSLKQCIEKIKTFAAAYYLVENKKRSEFIAINDDIKLELSVLIIIQMIRTKKFRNSMEEIYKNLLLDHINKIDSSLLDGLELEMDKEYFKHQHIKILNGEEKNKTLFAYILSNHIWYVGVNNTSHGLYTSDNPVVNLAHLKGRKLDSKGVEIVYPITDKLIIVMKERSFHKSYEKYENKFKMLTEEEVYLYNKQQILECYRNVFCKKNDFELVKEIDILN